jgi:hypothetical protein
LDEFLDQGQKELVLTAEEYNKRKKAELQRLPSWIRTNPAGGPGSVANYNRLKQNLKTLKVQNDAKG